MRLNTPATVIVVLILLIANSTFASSFHAQGGAAVGEPRFTTRNNYEYAIWFDLTGFAPNSTITVTNSFSSINCHDGGHNNRSWTATAGPTDQNGNLTIGYIHGDYGTYNFAFSDNQGNTVPKTVTVGIEIFVGPCAGLGGAPTQPPPPPPTQPPQEPPQPTPSCSVSSINVSPTNGQTGTVFTISGSGSCNTGVRAVRIKVNGGIIYEIGAPNATSTWNSSSSSPGMYTATVEVAGQGDNDWIYAARQDVYFTVGSPSPTSAPVQSPPAPPPNMPNCTVASASVNPQNGDVGTTFTINGSGSCNTGVRAIRFKVDGNIVQELGVPQLTWGWNSGGSWTGTHTATIEVAGVGDNNWQAAATRTLQFVVTGSGGQESPVVPIATQSPRRVLAYGSNTAPNGSYVHVPANITELRLRSGAGTNFSILGYVVANQYYELLEQSGDWVRISTSIGEGWVSRNYVEVMSTSTPPDDPQSQPPPPPQGPQPGPRPPTLASVGATGTNICNPDCETDHGNWIEFILPANRYVDGAFVLNTSIFAAIPLTIANSSSVCRNRPSVIEDEICIEIGIRHSILSFLVRSGLVSIDGLRNPNNWSLTYQPR